MTSIAERSPGSTGWPGQQLIHPDEKTVTTNDDDTENWKQENNDKDKHAPLLLVALFIFRGNGLIVLTHSPSNSLFLYWQAEFLTTAKRLDKN